MEATDITIEILKSIRDEARSTNQHLDELKQQVGGLNRRVDGLNERVDGLNERMDRMERRQTEAEIRVATELTALARAVNEVRDLLRENLDVHDKANLAGHVRPKT
jgi:chromosome segregation ATPase